MPAHESARISPTAHYTSYVWFRNGMSHRTLTSPLGAFLFRALQPLNLAYQHLGRRASLEMMLLARHRSIDHFLTEAIDSGAVRQVLEVAAGFSPRGFQLARRHQAQGLIYVEADLPAQASRKRAALDEAGLRGPNHRVVGLDALAHDGELSLGAVADAHLDPTLGTAIVTEGLLGYFDRTSVEGMWRRFAACLARFPVGRYYSDLNLDGDMVGMRGARAFRVLLQLFARGRVYLHYHSGEEAEGALRQAGFQGARLHLPGELPAAVEIPGRDRAHLVRVIEAST